LEALVGPEVVWGAAGIACTEFAVTSAILSVASDAAVVALATAFGAVVSAELIFEADLKILL
jgi:hypothetical protein